MQREVTATSPGPFWSLLGLSHPPASQFPKSFLTLVAKDSSSNFLQMQSMVSASLLESALFPQSSPSLFSIAFLTHWLWHGE